MVSVPVKAVLLVHEPKQKSTTKYFGNQGFHFDYFFDEMAANDLVYMFTAKLLVQSIFVEAWKHVSPTIRQEAAKLIR